MSEEQPTALESQIVQLERELAKRRAELGVEQLAPIEREEVHAMIGDQFPPQSAPQTSTPTSDDDTSSWQNPALKDAVQQLVQIAFSKSIQVAIDEAVKTGNPALVDALHDVLVDQLHQELVNRQKLQPAP